MISFIARPIKGIGQQASSLIVVALSHLEPLVDQNPEGTITHNFFEVSKVFDNPSGRLTIRIRSHEAHDVSWRDLQNVLEGLNEFYIHDPATGSYRDWASRFQVNKAGLGTTGQGILTFVRSTVAKRTSVAISLSRSSNTSLSLPEFATPTPFPVPETSLTLICNNIGEFIPDFGRDSSYVIVGARLKIMHLVEQYPDGRVPNNRYQYSEVYSIDQKVSIVVYAYGDHDITWIELDDILLGLTSYQLGDVEAGVVGHDQGVQFTVDKNGEGRIGLGNLRSSTTARSVSKRATSSTSPSSSNETLLKTINTTLLVSPPANTSTPNSVSESVDPPLPIPFPIEGTSLSLSITGIGTTSIPYSIVHDLFTGAFASINHDWVTHPNDSMTFPYFQYSAQSVHGEMVSISVHHNMWNEVTWWQLSRILGGVQEFMVGGVCMSRGVSFEVGGNRRVIGTGLVYYSSRSSGGRVVERSFEG